MTKIKPEPLKEKVVEYAGLSVVYTKDVREAVEWLISKLSSELNEPTCSGNIIEMRIKEAFEDVMKG